MYICREREREGVPIGFWNEGPASSIELGEYFAANRANEGIIEIGMRVGIEEANEAKGK